MRRKHVCSLLLSLTLALALLTGCGSSAMKEESRPAEGNGSFAPMEDMVESPEAEPEEQAPPTENSAKLIYRGRLEMETTAFDQVAADLDRLVKEMGGYLESSSLHNYGGGYRSAEYTVRVPVEHYETFFTSAGALCHVTWKNEETENVTRAYYDMAGRLKTQETKLARLQELLEKAESMEDIITIESAISETEYQIESLSGELSYYDDLVEYATVTINLQEVYKLSNTEEPAQGFGDRLGMAFVSGVRSFLSGAENLVVSLAYQWPWVLLAAVVVVLLVRRTRRKKKTDGGENRQSSIRFRRKEKSNDQDEEQK